MQLSNPKSRILITIFSPLISSYTFVSLKSLANGKPLMCFHQNNLNYTNNNFITPIVPNFILKNVLKYC